ncbi:hypothetical protein QTJ16_000288 [Diplocarpon rosae]|uniref:Uncharacterized protein n=1 Tax=Diplocarpon rosae TaxID=946125 RepID=A0AAD9T3R1_9HELO|nr:hypothetical protein QTJ16_000288 [Diplocarpon rosae]
MVEVDKCGSQVLEVVVEVIYYPIRNDTLGSRVDAGRLDELSVIVDANPMYYGELVCEPIDMAQQPNDLARGQLAK